MWKQVVIHMEKLKLDPHLPPYLQLQVDLGLHVNNKILTHLEENLGEYLFLWLQSKELLF